MFKQLAKSIREYRRDSLLAPLMVTLEVVMEVLIPIMMASLIDHGIEAGDMGYILKLGAAMVAAALLSLVFGALSGKFAASASAGFAKNLRRDMYYNIQNYSFGNIDKFSTPSLITRLTTDVTNVQNAYQMIIRMLVRSPVMFLSAMCMAFYVNASLAMVFLILTPFLGAGLYLVATRAHPHFVRVFKRYDQLNTVVQENIRGIRVVKSFVREEHEAGKFEERSEEIYDDFVKAEKILAVNSPLMQFCIYLSILLVSWIGAHLIISQVMTTGDLMSIFVYIMQILNSLMMLSMVLVMIIISKASAERIVEILREQSTLSNGPNPVRELPDSSIEFDHVNFSYAKSADNPDKLVLRDVCLRLESGETVGILGGTGSSKSSLIHLIPRLYDVTSGSVRVGGVDVRDYDMEALRESIAVVLQKNVLFSGTIKENLRWGNPDATDEQLVRACELAQADSFIRAFPQGYDTYIEQGGSNVSGGQKQRLCIARALLKRPKILILDDSTSAVDTKTDALIRRAMRENIPDTTKIIIAQRVSSVEDADKVIVLDHGRVDGFGSPADLLRSNRIYQEVYRSQNSEKSDSLAGKEANGHA